MITPYDLTPVNGPQDGCIRDVGFQEIDIKTGELLFEWRWSVHWDITDVIMYPNGTQGSCSTPWDPFHINSVHKDDAGNYLVSSRHTSTVGYVDGRTGEFIWKLGGKENMFEDLSGGVATGISMQHHARFFEGNRSTITLFNNGVSLDGSKYRSKGLVVDLDFQAMTAKVRREYLSPHEKGSDSRGSMQVLANGHVLLGYGVNPGWSEFSKDGDILCDVHFGPGSRFGSEDVLSYRVLKREWVGRPKTRPSVVGKGGDIYVSWNGATEVAVWALGEEDVDISNYGSLASVPREGFETRIPVPSNLDMTPLRVFGLDGYGNVLGSAPVVRGFGAADQGVQIPMPMAN